MAKFTFRYQVVLQQRRSVEDQRQRELARHLRGRMILEDQLRQMQDTVRDSKHQIGAGLIGKVDLAAIGRVAQYGSQVALRGRQIVEQLARRQRLIDEARVQLLEATRQRKALELLHDKHYQRWLEDQNRREIAELDDMNNQRYARQMAMEAGL